LLILTVINLSVSGYQCKLEVELFEYIRNPHRRTSWKL